MALANSSSSSLISLVCGSRSEDVQMNLARTNSVQQLVVRAQAHGIDLDEAFGVGRIVLSFLVHGDKLLIVEGER